MATAQQADLVVNQTAVPLVGPAGGVFTFSVRVANNGFSSAAAVALTDTLPAGAVFVSATPSQGSCGAPVGSLLNCDLGAIAAFAEASVDVRVRLNTPGVATNTASATSATPDPDANNNTNNAENVTVTVGADMTLTVIDAPDPVAAGAPYTYTVTATNNGPTALGGADTQSLSFPVPSGSAITSVPTGAGWSCVPGGGYPLSVGTITCTRTGALAVGASAPALTVPAVANSAGFITGSFSVASSLGDGDPSNNTAVATTQVSGGSSDVSIAKGASPAGNVGLGATVTYTITPRHNGGVPPGSTGAGVITVTDSVPAGLSLASAPTGGGWTCTPNAGFPIAGPVPIQCTRGAYNGGNFTNMPAITYTATVTAAGPLANTAAISIPETDPNPGNNSAISTITGTNDADMSVTKSASLNPVVPNQDFNFLVVARNNGPVALTGADTITVTDTIPANVTVTAPPTGTGWTCTPSAGFPLAGPLTVSCTRPGPLGVNANAPTITIPARITTATTITNTAAVAVPSRNDPNPGNNSGSTNVTATGTEADLEVTAKTASPNPVAAGENLTYTITVRNNSATVTATNVIVGDTLSSLVTTGGFQSAAASQGSCTPAGVTDGPTVNLSCNVGSLAPGATATVTVVVRPSIATTGPRSNTATVTSNDIGDPNRTNNSLTVSSGVQARVDLGVAKTDSPDPVQAGTNLTYVVTATNGGPSTVGTMVITDTLPGNAAFVDVQSVSGGGTCPTQPAAGATGGTLVCQWTNVPAGQQRTVTLRVRPLNGAVGANTVANNVVVSTPDTPLAATNTLPDAASAVTSVTAASADLVLSKSDDPDPVGVGETITYTVTVRNAGPSFATNVVLVDTFPAGAPAPASTATFSYQGTLTTSQGSCTQPAVGATAGTITCNLGDLPNGATATVTYRMRAESIAAGVVGTKRNFGSVSATEPDPLAANNTDTEDTTTRFLADLGVAKSAPGSINAGDEFDYTITVTNNGPNASVGARVTDPIPAGLTFVSASAGCAFAAGTVTCTLGTLPSGGSQALTIRVRVGSPYTGANPIANTATVQTINEIDRVAGNNSATANTTAVVGASVGNLVFRDDNANGVQDAGEPGVGGVTVRLLNSVGAVIATTTTTGAGAYSFAGLAPGTYAVEFVAPAGTAFTRQNAGGNPATDSDAAPTGPNVGRTAQFALAAGASNADIDAGLVRFSSLGGTVYEDANLNGSLSPGEPGINGVTLTLTGTDDLGNAVSRTTTTAGAGAAAGQYSFANLRPGTYAITQTQPAGFNNAQTTVGTQGGTAGVNTITGIALGQNVTGAGNNFGEVSNATGTLGNLVWRDANGNGQQDPGEPGVAGVTVTLFNAATNAQVGAPVVTDGNGNWSFTGLPPGSYYVVFSGVPAGLDFTRPNQGPDATDSDVAPTGPTRGRSDTVTLGGAQPLANGSVAAGLVPLSSIAGTVYIDTNSNGSLTPGEPGINGVTLTLTGTDDLGNPVNLTTLTAGAGAAAGQYAFANLRPGNYVVTQTQPAGFGNGQTSVGSQGGTAGVNTITGIALAPGTSGTGNHFGELAAAGVPVANNDSATTPLNTPVTLNAPANDAPSAGSSLVPGSIDLDPATPNQQTTFTVPGQGTFTLNPLTGQVTFTPVTGFVGVSTIPYTIADTSGGRSSPANLTVTIVNAPAANNDSATTPLNTPVTLNPTGNDSPSAGAVLLPGSIDLDPTTPQQETTRTVPGQGTFTLDTTTGRVTFTPVTGFTGTVTIPYTVRDSAGGTSNQATLAVTIRSGPVANNDSTTTPLNTPVTLNVPANDVASGAATVAAGSVDLDPAAPGQQLTRTVPGQGTFTVNPATGQVTFAPVGGFTGVSTIPYTILDSNGVASNVANISVTVAALASVSGRVWVDANRDRNFAGGERLVPGWRVELFDPATGAVVGQATTDANGAYTIANVPPFQPYRLRFIDPASGVVFGTPVTRESGTNVSGGAPVTGTASLVTTPAGSRATVDAGLGALDVFLQPGDALTQQSLPIDPSGVVYDAVNRVPVPGSRVTLTAEAGCPFNPAVHLVGGPSYAISGSAASMTVGPDGFYQYLLSPAFGATCNFTLTVVPPAGFTFQSTRIPPQAGTLSPPGGPGTSFEVQPGVPGAPPSSIANPVYYLALRLGPGTANVVFNHIPLDPVIAGAPGLFITKIGDRREAELGDTVLYTIVVSNNSSTGPVAVNDNLPLGFRFVDGTARLAVAGALPAPLPDAAIAGRPGPRLAFNIGTVPTGTQATLTYRVRVAIGAQSGDGINRAFAVRTGTSVQSNTAQWAVRVTGGVFTREACLAGKIFVDCNQNRVQDEGEPGIPGVRLYFEDGTFLVSDEEGKYSICGLRAITHVLKVDPTTLPLGARLGTTSNRNAGDAGSLFVDLKAGELHRADFLERSCTSKVREQVEERRRNPAVVVPLIQRGPDKPGTTFDSNIHRIPQPPACDPRGANQCPPGSVR